MNERLFDLLISSFGAIFIQGIKVTIPLTIISFLLAMIIALITAIVQVANIKVFKQLAHFMCGSFVGPRF